MSAPSEYTDWGSGDKAMLINPIPGSQFGTVVFNYNPEKISQTRTAKTEMKSSTSAEPPKWNWSKPTRITIQDIVFEGLDTKARCDLLLSWTVPPSESFLARIFEMQPDLPQLLFQWGLPGLGFVERVHLQQFSAVYNRFTDIGVPIRATVSLTLEDVPFKCVPTNPTSGGLPGRGERTVREGDSLARITKQAYGHPRRWRDVARANGIDDPLRVRPGQRIYLPNEAEFTKDVP